MKAQRLGESIQTSNRTQPFEVSRIANSSATIQNATGLLSRAWRWIRDRQVARTSTKRLQVTSTVSLGEKRFVAVVQVDGQQYLIGGGASNVALLAQLDKKESFGNVLEEAVTLPKKKPVRRESTLLEKPRVKQSKARAWSTL